MLALLYDVHGNLPALDAALADARERGADRYVLGGDYALFGAFPHETVTRLRELRPVTWLRGNGERWTAEPATAPGDEVVQGAIAAARADLGDALTSDLAALPFQTVVDGTRYCHASPLSDVRSFLPEPAEDEAELLAGVEEERLVFGHTHLPFARTAASGVELVNPGSVGMPFDGDMRAAYALLHDDGRVEHLRVPYDSGRTLATLRERYGSQGWVATVLRRIETASF